MHREPLLLYLRLEQRGMSGTHIATRLATSDWLDKQLSLRFGVRTRH
jgi:hypothetical protein